MKIAKWMQAVRAAKKGALMDKVEWICEECDETGVYADLRKPIDHGVDFCPSCGSEVSCVEEG